MRLAFAFAVALAAALAVAEARSPRPGAALSPGDEHRLAAVGRAAMSDAASLRAERERDSSMSSSSGSTTDGPKARAASDHVGALLPDAWFAPPLRLHAAQSENATEACVDEGINCDDGEFPVESCGNVTAALCRDVPIARRACRKSCDAC